jgi:hypothetical protein
MYDLLTFPPRLGGRERGGFWWGILNSYSSGGNRRGEDRWREEEAGWRRMRRDVEAEAF